jgi:hypothetical protein
MGRRSKIATGISDDIKAEKPRRPRKKREPRIIPLGLKAGQLVLILVPREKLKRFGIVMEACKYNDGGITVRLSDDGAIAKYFCVRPELGDTIERLNSSDGNEKDK